MKKPSIEVLKAALNAAFSDQQKLRERVAGDICKNPDWPTEYEEHVRNVLTPAAEEAEAHRNALMDLIDATMAQSCPICAN